MRGDSQSAYRIIVSKEKEDIENGKGTVWDSGKVESPDMLSVKYEGEALESRTTYYWNVTVFAKSGLSASGKGSVFSTGILDEYEATDYPLPEYSAQVFAFEETEARYVRLYADSLRPKETDGNRYFLQITEFEVYDLPEYTEADKSALEETLATMLGVIGGSIYSGASDDAKNSFGIALALAQGVFDDEYALDSEVEKALGDLTDAYEALEKSSEEGQTPGTEAPDEDVTTAPDTEKSPSDDPDKGGKDSGALPFIIGGVVIVVVAAAGVTVFLVLRKKKK